MVMLYFCILFLKQDCKTVLFFSLYYLLLALLHQHCLNDCRIPTSLLSYSQCTLKCLNKLTRIVTLINHNGIHIRYCDMILSTPLSHISFNSCCSLIVISFSFFIKCIFPLECRTIYNYILCPLESVCKL